MGEGGLRTFGHLPLRKEGFYPTAADKTNPKAIVANALVQIDLRAERCRAANKRNKNTAGNPIKPQPTKKIA